MEGFSYTNIFETKGIEYLTIIAFFAILIPFWALVNRKVKYSVQSQKSNGFITASSLRIPQGIFFSKFHSWAHLEKNGEAKVGLDDLLLHLTGEVEITHLKKPGEQIKKGDLLVEIRHNGNNLQIHSPVSGKISNTNTRLSENPGLLTESPYRLGWIYSIQPTNWKAETNSCYLAEDATNWAIQELERFKDFLSAATVKNMPEPAGVVMQDGGEVIDNPLTKFPREVWDDFQKNFLS